MAGMQAELPAPSPILAATPDGFAQEWSNHTEPRPGNVLVHTILAIPRPLAGSCTKGVNIHPPSFLVSFLERSCSSARSLVCVCVCVCVF